MRASELLGSRVVDRAGRSVGAVRDLRLVRLPDGRFRAVGLVVARGALANAAYTWGFADGRSSGPWVLRKLVARGVDGARFVPASAVDAWGPATVEISQFASELPHLDEVTE